MSSNLTRGELKAAEDVLDRIEDRLADAPLGLHQVGEPTGTEVVVAAGLPASAAPLWERYDGLDLANGEVVILPVDAVADATREAGEEGLLRAGDLVIGERGRALLVLPSDPWEEGGEVVMVEDDGERGPYGSTVPRTVLALIGECSVLYGDDGEFQEELFGDDGELTGPAHRRLLRRHLDLDPDAPLPRFQLARILRDDGELRGARRELEAVVHRAPSFAWAQLELGRVSWKLERLRPASRAFAAASEAAEDPGLKAMALAWLAATSNDEREIENARAGALAAMPELPATAEAGAREALADGDVDRARELVAAGLAVSPSSLGLLDLRKRMSPSSDPSEG